MTKKILIFLSLFSFFYFYKIKKQEVITPEKIREFTPEQIKELTIEQIKEFTPNHIKEFTLEQIKEFTLEQFKIFTLEQLLNITQLQVKEFSIWSLNVFLTKRVGINIKDCFKKSIIRSSVFLMGGCVRNCFKVLTLNQIHSFMKFFFQFVSLQEFQKMLLEQARFVSSENICKLTPEQIKIFTKRQFEQISLENIQKLTPKQIQAFTLEQVENISPEMFQMLDLKQVKAFTQEQVDKFSNKIFFLFNQWKIPKIKETLVRVLNEEYETKEIYNEEEPCSICFKEMSERNQKKLKCGHVFCKGCLRGSILTNHFNCPLCRFLF